MGGNVKQVITVTLVAAVLLGSFAGAFAEDTLAPKIFIQKMRHDFGKTYERETFEYTFKVKNKGKADLVINNVKPG